jgi:hypothetical protein
VFVYSSGSWSPGRAVDPGNSLTGVSCPSASFCMLIDSAGNALTTTDPTNGAHAAWSVALSIDPGVHLNAVSCASALFCAAVAQGTAVTFSSGAWEAPASISGAQDISAVSCPSSSFCAAVDESGNAMLYQGGIWSGAHSAVGHAFTSLSCPSAAFCVAGDIAGEVSEFTGAVWGAAHAVNARSSEEEEENEYHTALRSVSCASSTSCVAVGARGDAETLSGVVWSAPAQLGSNGYLTAVSCPSSSSCSAAGSAGVMVFSGSSWGGPYAVDPQPTPMNTLSCIASLCLAGDSAGNVLTSLNAGASWGAPLPIAPGTAIVSISCPSTTLCVAINNNGQDITTTDPEHGASATWTAPTIVQYDHVFSSLTCASTTLCSIVNGEGAVMTTTNPAAGASAAWSAPKQPSGPHMFMMSCPSATLCVGVEWDGKAVTTTNPAAGSSATWHATTTVISSHGPSAISCASTTLCVAVNNDGSAEITTNPVEGAAATWHPLAAVSGGNWLQSVSCPSTAFCVVGNTEGKAFRINSPLEGSSATWSSLGSIDPGNYMILTCPSASSCYSVDNRGYGVMYSELVLNTTASPALSTDHPVVGSTLSVSNGTWEGPGPITYTYQWEACNGSGTACAPIAGASAATYAPSEGQAGNRLRAAVSAANAGGPEQATSEISASVAAMAPAGSHAPALSTRHVVVGTALSVSQGSWAGSQPMTYAYQWQRCNAQGGECASVEAGTTASYTPLEGDVGHTLRALVTATNAGGTGEVASDLSEVVPAATAAVDPPPVPTVSVVSHEVQSEPPLVILPALLTGLTLTGKDEVGQVLVVNAGRWTGSGALVWAYRWQRRGARGFVDIANATRAGYRLTAEDKQVRAVVSVTGPAGVVHELSDVVTVHPTPRAAPVNGHHAPRRRPRH